MIDEKYLNLLCEKTGIPRSHIKQADICKTLDVGHGIKYHFNEKPIALTLYPLDGKCSCVFFFFDNDLIKTIEKDKSNRKESTNGDKKERSSNTELRNQD